MSPPFSWQLNSRWRHQNPRNSRIKGSPFSNHRVTGGEGLVQESRVAPFRLPEGTVTACKPIPASFRFFPLLPFPSFPSLSLQYVLASRQLVAAYINVFGWFRGRFRGVVRQIAAWKEKKTRIQLVLPSSRLSGRLFDYIVSRKKSITSLNLFFLFAFNFFFFLNYA